VLVGPDPVPIEVKTNSNVNSRVARQVRSITELMKLFQKDRAENFRELSSVE
jgi:hypothetical protein